MTNSAKQKKKTSNEASTKPITGKKLDAAFLIASGHSTVEAANLCGVCRQTVSQWKNHDVAFQEKLQELDMERHDTARRLIESTYNGALHEIQNLMKTGTPETRLKTIKYFFKNFSRNMRDSVQPNDLFQDNNEMIRAAIQPHKKNPLQ